MRCSALPWRAAEFAAVAVTEYCHTPTGLTGRLRAIGASVVALVGARLELIAVEVQEQHERARRQLLLVVLAAMFLATGMLLAAMLVVLLFWDTHRLLAAGAVTALYLGAAGVALAQLRQLQERHASPFAATLAEFAADAKQFFGRHE